MVILDFICEIPTIIHSWLAFKKTDMALGTLFSWLKNGNVVVGLLETLILKWTGYQRSLIGKDLGSTRGCKMDET